jgi:hypothetical protein
MFVFHPLVFVMDTVEQVPVQPVWIDTIWPAGIAVTLFGCPLHASVSVVDVPPPLNASSEISRRGVMKVKLPVVCAALRKLALFVVKSPHGPEWYQTPEPQFTTFVGYWPLSG